MSRSSSYAAVVLAGGRAARLGGQAKPQLQVGGRSMLDAVLAAVPDAAPRVVVGPAQPVPADVVLTREDPPGGGPVRALAAGLVRVDVDVVAVLAADLPFLTADLVRELRERFDDAAGHDLGAGCDGVVVVDPTGRDQHLLGVWRTAALRRALADSSGHRSMRALLAGLDVRRHRPGLPAAGPAPWTDCDTPADLERARAGVPDGLGG